MQFLALIKNDLRHYFNSKFAFIVMIIFPIITILTIANLSSSLLTNSSAIDPIPLVIVDKEESFYTDFFIQKITETSSLQSNIEIIKTDEKMGQNLIDSNNAAGMVIIPEDFTDNMQKGIFEPLIVIGNHKRPLQATIIKEGMGSVTNLMSAAQSAVFTVCDYAREYEVSQEQIDLIFQRAAMSFSLKALGRDHIFSETIKTPWMDMEPTYFYFSSLLIFFVSLYGLQGMYLYISEKENKITTRIRSLGIPLWKIILAKWISLTLFLFIQAGIILSVFIALELFELTGNLKLGLLLLLIICACISSLTLFITSLSKNAYIASMAIFIISILGVFVGGGIVPYSYMPDFIGVLGKLTMNHWALEGLTYSLFGNQVGIVWKSITIIAMLTISFLCAMLVKLSREENKYETI